MIFAIWVDFWFGLWSGVVWRYSFSCFNPRWANIFCKYFGTPSLSHCSDSVIWQVLNYTTFTVRFLVVFESHCSWLLAVWPWRPRASWIWEESYYRSTHGGTHKHPTSTKSKWKCSWRTLDSETGGLWWPPYSGNSRMEGRRI